MEKKGLTNWQAVGIGAVVGVIATILVWIIVINQNIWIPSGVSSITFGIGGALAGKSWFKTRLATWICAVVGGVLGPTLLYYIFVFFIYRS